MFQVTPIITDNLAATFALTCQQPGDKIGHIIPHERNDFMGYAFCWHDTSEQCTEHAKELGLINGT